MRLLAVELQRLRARKILWVTLAGAIVVVAATLLTLFLQAREIDLARAGFHENYQQMVDEHDQMVADCVREEGLERRRSGDPSIDFGCDQMQIPTIEEMYGEIPPLDEQYAQMLSALVYAFAFLALVLGSTAVAAEFSHRTMGTWLTFEPRRTRVFVAKIVAPALAAVPMTVVGLLLVLLGVPAILRWWGMNDGLGAQAWTDLAWMALRVLLVVMLAAALGAGAAFLVRHSGVVVGIVVGYLVLVEGMLGNGLTSIQRYLLGRNISAVVNDGTTWETWTNCTFDGCEPIRHTLSLTHGAVVLLVVVGLVALLAWGRFVRADVD